MSISYATLFTFPGAVSIERYDLRTDSWGLVDNMSGRRLQFGVAVIDDKLFLVGGRDGLKTLNTVECYDPTKKSWTPMPSMGTHRHGLGKFWLQEIIFRKLNSRTSFFKGRILSINSMTNYVFELMNELKTLMH